MNLFKISSTPTLSTLVELGILLEPVPTYQPYAELKPLSSGGTRGVGFPIVEWHYGFIPATQRDIFKSFCPGASADICISTFVRGEYLDFQGKMMWPLQERYAVTQYLDWTLIFTHLIPLS